MNEPSHFLNGQWVNRVSLALDIEDLGVLQGVAVSERLRTFRGQVFRLADHLQRLHHSLEIIGIDPDAICRQIESILPEVIARNLRGMDADDDLSIALFVTPGKTVPDRQPIDGRADQPTVCISARPIPFADWADKYTHGEHLVVSDVRQIPANCWPPELKCRSRMHYYLADRQARKRDSAARALLLDGNGFVGETSTANVILVVKDVFVSPRIDKILPGVSLTMVRELASQEGIPFTLRDIEPDEVAVANEVLLVSTSPCLLPVTSCNGQPIGQGVPGPIFSRLLAAWSRQVGVSIADQARRFARRVWI
ncbi:MAG: aminotransferase class IV family protein [Pirellulales bacterium]|nr:aminotransferase class IV family protein [Pirellulales bacterium]